MKKIFLLFVILFISGLLFTSPSYCQGDPNGPDEQLTKEQAVARIAEWQTKVDILKTQLANATANVDKLKAELDDAVKQLKDCNDALYDMLGANLAAIDAFRQKLGVIEGKVREMQRLSDDVLADRQEDVFALEAELNELRRDKISLLPEFYNKILKLAKDINPGLIREKKIRSYTVGTWAENRDCLWNIAGKIEIYGDPFQWPKIWQANTEIVRNPDIIHPGQVLQLPPPGPKTDDEIKAERRYWRHKREAMEQQQAQPAEEGKQ